MKNNINLQLFAEPVPVEGVQQPQDKTPAAARIMLLMLGRHKFMRR